MLYKTYHEDQDVEECDREDAGAVEPVGGARASPQDELVNTNFKLPPTGLPLHGILMNEITSDNSSTAVTDETGWRPTRCVVFWGRF